MAGQSLAQDSAAAPAKAADTGSTDSGAYSLKGGTVDSGSAVTTRQGAVTAPYELGGGISAGHSGQGILTAALPERGAPIRTEAGVFIYPSVFAAYGYNDNLQSSQTNKVASSLVNVVPRVVAEMKNHGDRYTAMFAGNMTRYSSSSADNYNNYEAWLAGDNYFSARARMGWALGQTQNTDPRGSNGRALSNTPDRWTAPTAKGRFIYGAPEASGRFEADADIQHKRYDNNLTFTEIANLNTTDVAGRFLFRVGSRSMVLVEARNKVADYTSAASTGDNTERKLYLGYTWEATAATTGILKIGRVNKKFDQAGGETYSAGSWEAVVRWLPRTYSSIEFFSSKAPADATGIGTYMVNTNNALTWAHQWTGALSSRATLGALNTNYAGTGRIDDVRNLSLTVDYALRRWLTIGADFANTDSKSNVSGAGFKRNITLFTLNAAL